LAGSGRATAFDFTGSGGRQTWIGVVALDADGRTGAHHHGRHEVAVYVVKGRGEIRWGDRLDFATDIAPGDVVYFPPYVPHQEINCGIREPLELLVVRSDNARIATELDVAAIEHPQRIA
jgi:uncharacterized RmlC-like cupin family protein